MSHGGSILTEHERKITHEFTHLLEKSKQLFNGLRLRTSDTGYLLEAFSFYSAIRNRAYYSKAAKEDRPELMVKKLRYYARFVVVCLLLKKLKLVRDLIRELSRQVEEYVTTYKPEDHLEWTLVLTEIKSFVEADSVVNIIDVDSSTVILSHRLTSYITPPLEKGIPQCLTLQEVLIVGNTSDQVKYSEFTLDMYWMLQALEREPQEDITFSARSHETSPAPGRLPCYDNELKYDNPHKYLLYKPTFAQLMLFLGSGIKELPPHSALLLYISADGVFADPARNRPSANYSYDFGGVAMNSRRDNSMPSDLCNSLNRAPMRFKEPHCLHPGDLYPFLRKPFVLIVDSDNSSVFLGMPKLFGQPLVVLASPEEIPPFLEEQPRRGSLLTLFLHSPLTAFCYICNHVDIPIAMWDKCQAHIDKFICEAGKLLVRAPNLDKSYLDFYGDEFLRLLLLRFIFCSVVLRCHRKFKGSATFHPHCYPPMPDAELLQQTTLVRLVLDLAMVLDVLAAFRDSDETYC